MHFCRDRQVLRYGWLTRAAAAVVLLLLVGGTLRYALPGLLAQARSTQAVATARDTAAEQSMAAIRTAVSLQEKALAAADADQYISLIDPASAPYAMEQRHWMEDLSVWRAKHPDARVTRTVREISLLGTNTARVHITINVPGVEPATVRTIWVQMPDGRWLEHGPDHEVYGSDAVTIWYPASADPQKIQELAESARQAQILLRDRLGWTVARPPVWEVMRDLGAFRTSLGPDLATRKNLLNWLDFGEPVRMSMDGPGWAPSVVMRWVANQAVMEASANHAAEWWREGLTRYALGRTGMWKVSDALATYRTRAPVDLSQLPKLHPGYDLPAEQFEQVGDTVWLFAITWRASTAMARWAASSSGWASGALTCA